MDKKLKRPGAAPYQANRRSGKNRDPFPIIPPRILARADEVIEQAHRHVNFWQ
ncbi:hypothetical protein [Bradyrhizobium sp. JYMT SZCCT0428]|uniref:hypothetical protein n=1 Tax=Bradyrhizobium sp. JYMT SZCCT0428 TaxID=2807673 RepID=UPI001BAAD715|nr:hypothetical protein [Bradyrhizobium sp. JYMT SZCCT0428]MBR1157253.1 hypothetical protein [Bradyrhizobium sp. JYMT SZCCT0428]